MDKTLNLEGSVGQLKGIGEKTEALFTKAGIGSIEQLLCYYPRTYDIFEKPVSIQNITDGMLCAVEADVLTGASVQPVKTFQIVTASVGDGTGVLSLVWFNMAFLKSKIKYGFHFIFRGRIRLKKQKLVMEQPEIFTVHDYFTIMNTMQPVYSLIAGMTNKMITKAVRQVLECTKIISDPLPECIRLDLQLLPFESALYAIHFPKDREEFQKGRKRFVFEEFFLFAMALRYLKQSQEKIKNQYKIKVTEKADALVRKLPYELTLAQQKVWIEIKEDLNGENMMSRLIQGDVGSGKTILAVLAVVSVVLNGYQAAFMVPTEVLAKQHYDSVKQLFDHTGIPIEPILLTGSMTQKEKRIAYEKLETGQASFVIGTHALIQEKVNYHNLALVIADEQHRFGVRQREALSDKGFHPHILVMSATPIPRTMAIILYGDLEISVLNELPADRVPIKNCVVDIGYRPSAFSFMKKEIQKGRQVYIICPMVEESELLDAENVMDYSEMLRSSFPCEIQIAYLHGKMKAAEKNKVLEQFTNGDIHILVSTTVVEVGVNVPNATVMMVENAERFGLAQLHQLRGRVGRGKYQSYCIFVNGSGDKEKNKRLDVLNHSNDGFFIANEDLRLRGPGDVFGIRQSGIMDFKIGDIFQDAELLKIAAQQADNILNQDPKLEMPEHKYLYEKITKKEFINF